MHIIETVRFWWKVRKANKRLLAMAAKADRTPHAPPTVEEVKDFMRYMESRGVSFANMLQGMPRAPRVSREVIFKGSQEFNFKS